ncbi:hypothetical protein NFI96_028586 [Prochilodus magdalenae]|nr:hypothetical protein NFI96_028586 [Prochilodus magdalenae]
MSSVLWSVRPAVLLCLCVCVLADTEDTSLLEGWKEVWLFRFFLNVLGYATIVIPGYFLIGYFKRTNYLETGRGLCFPVIKACVFGSESKTTLLDDPSATPRNESESTSSARQAFKLVFCAAGLQASYLTWGVLQERVMTRSYGGSETEGGGERFRDSQFLVFMNRILALTVAGLCCVVFKQPRHAAPMYKYSFASLSNILSSWCQYEALKYISFPTQVLAKASKVIPVMLMGKLVSQKSYEYWEYFTAVLISVGVSMFLLSSSTNKHPSTVTTFSGVIILAGYIMFDSFTSNWQWAGGLSRVFPSLLPKDGRLRLNPQAHHLWDTVIPEFSSVQFIQNVRISVDSLDYTCGDLKPELEKKKLEGVHMFYCLFTVAFLLEQGTFFVSLAFMSRHSEFTLHAMLLSICSACGQFGAAVFTIMTQRQAFAILLSCFFCGHAITFVGAPRVVVVFLALSLCIYTRSAQPSAQPPVHGDNLFKYKMSSVQMMFGVNLFSCLFTVGSLLEQGAFFDSLAFMSRHSEFAFHAVLLSICSACGQLFIFYTIGQFGAAVFTIIMTLRQAIAILLSCFLYGHAVTFVGALGVAVVFLALFLRIYARSRMKKGSKRPAQPPVQKV